MNEIAITEYRDIRVLTTQQLAKSYGTDSKTISYNFNHNKDILKGNIIYTLQETI